MSSDRSSSDTEQVGGMAWGPDHPCFNGHDCSDSLTECSRCGADLELHPNGRWSVHAATEQSGGDR